MQLVGGVRALVERCIPLVSLELIVMRDGTTWLTIVVLLRSQGRVWIAV